MQEIEGSRRGSRVPSNGVVETERSPIESARIFARSQFFPDKPASENGQPGLLVIVNYFSSIGSDYNDKISSLQLLVAGSRAADCHTS